MAAKQKQDATTSAALTREQMEAKFGDKFSWLEPEIGRRYLVWTVTHAFAGLLVGRTMDYLVLGEVTQVFETGERAGVQGETFARAEKLYEKHFHRIPHGAIIDVSDLG